jgi:hypothetical protein
MAEELFMAGGTYYSIVLTVLMFGCVVELGEVYLVGGKGDTWRTHIYICNHIDI